MADHVSGYGAQHPFHHGQVLQILVAIEKKFSLIKFYTIRENISNFLFKELFSVKHD